MISRSAMWIYLRVMLLHLVFRRVLEFLIRLVLGLGMLLNAWILRRLFVKRPNGEGRSGTYDQQQRGNHKFPHGRNVARERGPRKYPKSLVQEE
jgi:hypothetical protein